MTAPLDPTQDPDRYDPAREAALPPGGLDPRLDPDRYDPAASLPSNGRGDTLPELLGAGAYDDTTSPYIFLLGLAGVLVFLGLVALVFSHLGS